MITKIKKNNKSNNEISDSDNGNKGKKKIYFF